MRGNGLLAVRMAGSLRPRLSPLAGSAAQNIIAGNGVGISHELISLEITSPEVPDLTLIDLPGIARVAVGNQPQDIGVQVRLSGTGVQTQLRGGGGSHGPSTLETGPPSGPHRTWLVVQTGTLTLRVEVRGVAHAPLTAVWGCGPIVTSCPDAQRKPEMWIFTWDLPVLATIFEKLTLRKVIGTWTVTLVGFTSLPMTSPLKAA